ncbi:hypothetical protein [Microtetraspora sp. NBRC 13810]|uniref:hypothetical protein n=1 Tax=Microtetraspora sp. NBRC 13810 TaxID=3030990 RepID=UPI00255281A3|nr:hypothetical protein [Microtetraspora sp. NBRC 13810]
MELAGRARGGGRRHPARGGHGVRHAGRSWTSTGRDLFDGERLRRPNVVWHLYTVAVLLGEDLTAPAPSPGGSLVIRARD